MGLSKMLYGLTGSGKFNMAIPKPEEPISKLLDNMGTIVQQLYINICFRGPATQWQVVQ